MEISKNSPGLIRTKMRKLKTFRFDTIFELMSEEKEDDVAEIETIDFEETDSENDWRWTDAHNRPYVFLRIGVKIEDINRNLRELQNELRKFEKEEISGEDLFRETCMKIRHLRDNLDDITEAFPEIEQKGWHHNFSEAIEGAHWRLEKGWFIKHENEPVIATYIRDILEHTDRKPEDDIIWRLKRFFEYRIEFLDQKKAAEDFQADIKEARDIACLGHYSSALFVMGRGIEKALNKLGNTREVKSIKAHGSTIKWRRASFYQMNEALKEVDLPDNSGKAINNKEYHEISKLIGYRNDVAHNSHHDLEKDQAMSEIESAFHLLKDLSERIEEIGEMEDINEVENQSI